MTRLKTSRASAQYRAQVDTRTKDHDNDRHCARHLEAKQVFCEPLEPRQLMSTVLPAGAAGPEVGNVILAGTNLATDLGVYAQVDGAGNNLANPLWGATGVQLLRITSVDYADGVSEPKSDGLPSARLVSNLVSTQTQEVSNSRGLSNLIWLFGQFVDHDLDLTEGAHDPEPFNINVPAGDLYFDPDHSGDDVITLDRSIYDPSTGTDTDNPRQQINQITAFLDGSNVYGSDAERAAALRTFVDGKLKTSEGNLLPFNELGLPNAGSTSDQMFLAGDVRANENAALSAMHTLWMREHNYWADQIATQSPDLTDEAIFTQARAIIVAELQAITYNEFLPALLGQGAISDYQGYDDSVNPGIANIFSTASYRVGHSLLSSEIPLVDAAGEVTDSLALLNLFFNPTALSTHGVDAILGGMASSKAQDIDTKIIDDVRNFLFGPPGAGGFDLVSLNIQRGRDHGLPSYNQARADLGLTPASSFADVTADLDLQAALEAAYGEVDLIDAWVGGLAEDHMPGGNVGELLRTVLADQFTSVRDGDRFWYENTYDAATVDAINTTTLASVIQRNTSLAGLQSHVFYDPTVMRFDMTDLGQRAKKTKLVVKTYPDRIDVKQQGRPAVLDTRSNTDASMMLIEGADDHKDRIKLDLRKGDAGLGKGVSIDAGNGDNDVLVIRLSRADDDVVIQPGRITVNGMSVDYYDVEKIRLKTGGRGDTITLASDTDAKLWVNGRRRKPDATNAAAAAPAASNHIVEAMAAATMKATDAQHDQTGTDGSLFRLVQIDADA